VNFLCLILFKWIHWLYRLWTEWMPYEIIFSSKELVIIICNRLISIWLVWEVLGIRSRRLTDWIIIRKRSKWWNINVQWNNNAFGLQTTEQLESWGSIRIGFLFSVEIFAIHISCWIQSSYIMKISLKWTLKLLHEFFFLFLWMNIEISYFYFIFNTSCIDRKKWN
jgi:hypothetical protein